MKAAAAVAEILKREGIRFLIGYPVSPIIEAAAEADIRTIIVRQERTGLHMADAVSRISSGQRIGVFAMQHGPGSENAFGGVAEAYGDSVPIVVLPGGYPRRITNVPPNFNSFLNFQHVTKWCEQVIMPDAVPDAMRRAFTQVKNGRPRPVLVEFPVDLLREEVPEPLQYTPAPRLRSAPDPRDVSRVAEALVAAAPPARRAARGAGDDEPAGQERLPGDTPALARLRRPFRLEAAPPLPRERRPDLRHRLQLRHDELRRDHAEGQAHRPRDARPHRHQQGHPRRPRADRRRRPHPRGAAGRGEGSSEGRAARPLRGRHAGDQEPQERVAGSLDAAAHGRYPAALAAPRDLGPHAHGRRPEHAHHPR